MEKKLYRLEKEQKERSLQVDVLLWFHRISQAHYAAMVLMRLCDPDNAFDEMLRFVMKTASYNNVH